MLCSGFVPLLYMRIVEVDAGDDISIDFPHGLAGLSSRVPSEQGCSSLQDMALDLSKVGRKSFVSQAGIAEVLQAVREAGELPKGVSKSSVKRSRQTAIAVETPYGPLLRNWTLTTADGKQELVHYLDPMACLWHALQTSEKLQAFFSRTTANSPCSLTNPWRIVVYSDEVSPGNQLKPTNKRKLQSFYWSFLEFGGRALAAEDAWFVLTTVRSETVAEFEDKLTQLTKFCLRCFSDTGRNMAHGMNLPWPGRPGFVLVAKVDVVLGDESALKQMLEFKGASGKVLCGLCRNCIQKRYAPEPMHPGTVHHTCTEDSRFMLHTKETLQRTVQYLKDQKALLPKNKFAALETDLGLNLCPQGVLCDPVCMEAMDPTKALMFDWMHIYLVGGIFHLEINLLLEKLVGAEVKQQELHSFFQSLSWPAYVNDKGAAVSDFFSKKKSNDNSLKSSASEALTAYPVFRLLLQDLRESRDLGLELRQAINSFICLCQVLDLLQQTSTGSVPPENLRRAIKLHLDTYQTAYPDGSFLPKHHLAMHLSMQLQRNGCLLSCFVQERRHKELKRYANQQTAAKKGTEVHLLKEVFLSHLEALERLDLEPPTGLQGAVKPATAVLQGMFCQQFGLASANGLLFSMSATVPRCRLIKTDDVVTLETGLVAKVLYHCSFANYIFTCVTFFKKGGRPNFFQLTSDSSFVSSTDIRGACMCREEDDGIRFVPQVFA